MGETKIITIPFGSQVHFNKTSFSVTFEGFRFRSDLSKKPWDTFDGRVKMEGFHCTSSQRVRAVNMG